jgi:hypothetical protein
MLTILGEIDVNKFLGAAVILSMMAGTAIAVPMSQAAGKTCSGAVMSPYGQPILVFIQPTVSSATVWIDFYGATQNRPEPAKGTPLMGTFPVSEGSDALEFTSLWGAQYKVKFDGLAIVGTALFRGKVMQVNLPCHMSS